MMLENDKLKFLVFAHHLSMLQACTEAVIENKVMIYQMCTHWISDFTNTQQVCLNWAELPGI